MAGITFDEVISLLNYSRTTQIDPTPTRTSEGVWAYYSGQHRVHTSSYPFRVLALQSRITKQEMTRLAKEVGGDDALHIVDAPSVETKAAKPRDVFGKTRKNIWNYREYLTSFIKDELKKYISTLEKQKPEFYIDPRIVVPAGLPSQDPEPSTEFSTR